MQYFFPGYHTETDFNLVLGASADHDWWHKSNKYNICCSKNFSQDMFLEWVTMAEMLLYRESITFLLQLENIEYNEFTFVTYCACWSCSVPVNCMSETKWIDLFLSRR